MVTRVGMNTAFWDAFLTGLACPTDLYTSRHGEDYEHVGSVETAWRKVGGYIYGSIDLGKTEGTDRYNRKRTK